jgi:AraC-like DNA-binding protein
VRGGIVKPWLAAGDLDLAGLAAELGFADQAHLTRVLRAETGTTPPRCARCSPAHRHADRRQRPHGLLGRGAGLPGAGIAWSAMPAAAGGG